MLIGALKAISNEASYSKQVTCPNERSVFTAVSCQTTVVVLRVEWQYSQKLKTFTVLCSLIVTEGFREIL